MRRASVILSLLAACAARETPFVADEGHGAEDLVSQIAMPTYGEVIRIGALFAFKGRASSTEENTLRGITVAVNAVNEAGGIGGRRVEIVKLEFDGSAPDAEAAARRAAGEGVVAVLGPSWSNPALAAAPILQEARVPMIVTLATHPDITRGRDHVFRISSDDRAQARALAGFVKDELAAGAHGYVTFVDLADTASLSYTTLFVEEMERRGCGEAARQTYTADDSDDKLRAEWREVLAKHPDARVAFLPLKVRDVGRVMRAGRDAGFGGTFVGGDGWGNIELLAAGGKAAVGAYFTSHWNEAVDEPTSLEFFERYVSLHKMIPTLGAALGYDAARALLGVIARVGPDRERVREGLAALTAFPSTTGPLRFDGDRNALRSVVILRVDLSRFTPYRILPPEAAGP
jgi:branched-chain amino acid transport system substrate-binding protein